MTTPDPSTTPRDPAAATTRSALAELTRELREAIRLSPLNKRNAIPFRHIAASLAGLADGVAASPAPSDPTPDEVIDRLEREAFADAEIAASTVRCPIHGTVRNARGDCFWCQHPELHQPEPPPTPAAKQYVPDSHPATHVPFSTPTPAAASEAVKGAIEALRLCIDALDKHDEWCGHNKGAPGNSIWYLSRNAALEALAALRATPATPAGCGTCEKLPKTADGVPIVPGMTVWWMDQSQIPETVTYVGRSNNIYIYSDGRHEFEAENFYSTRVAAASARARDAADGEQRHGEGEGQK